MSLIEKIDAEIAERYDKANNFPDLIIATNIITGLEIAKQIILSEQKEPCGYCYAWKLDKGINFCPNCGRPTQSPTDIS